MATAPHQDPGPRWRRIEAETPGSKHTRANDTACDATGHSGTPSLGGELGHTL